MAMVTAIANRIATPMAEAVEPVVLAETLRALLAAMHQLFWTMRVANTWPLHHERIPTKRKSIETIWTVVRLAIKERFIIRTTIASDLRVTTKIRWITTVMENTLLTETARTIRKYRVRTIWTAIIPMKARRNKICSRAERTRLTPIREATALLAVSIAP